MKKANKNKPAVGQAKMKYPGSEVKLTVLEENFCRAFCCISHPETFGRPRDAYAAAGYKLNNKDGNDSNVNNAYHILKRPKIQTRITELLAAQGLTDYGVDGEMLKVIKQDKDLSNKMRAISEYNKVKKRTGGGIGSAGGGITVNVLNYGQTNNDSSQLSAGETSVSVGDSEQPSEEQSVGSTQESWKEPDGDQQVDYGGL